MKSKKWLGPVLLLLGVISLNLRFFGGVPPLFGIILLITGTSIVVRQFELGKRLLSLVVGGRRDEAAPNRVPHADHLLPVRVLKLAEAREGVLTVSAVAIALDVELDAAQWALDELVRKGAANVDVDISTGIASYSFPEFVPHSVTGPLES